MTKWSRRADIISLNNKCLWVLFVFAVLLNSGLEHILVRANCKVTFYIRFQPNTIFWREEANESTQLHYVMICLFRKWVSELFMLNLMMSLSQGQWEENLVISPFFSVAQKMRQFWVSIHCNWNFSLFNILLR